MKFIKTVFLSACLFLPSVVMAQDDVDSANSNEALVGYWQKEGSSTIMDVRMVDGKVEGVITRSDWEPGFVGKIFIRNLEAGKKSKRWVGEGFDMKTSKYRKLTISFKNETVLKTKVKGRKSALWVRVESKFDVI